MAIGPSILEQEDALKGLPTQALQQMMRQPSPSTPPFLIAAELKRREQMAEEFAGNQAAVQVAQNAPTVADRLAGRQQPMPMSRAAAVASPPQQPPMPKEAQLAMALSGATGQPAPQLPTVNAARGRNNRVPPPSNYAEALRVLQRRGSPIYSQGKGNESFSSPQRPPPVMTPRFAAILAAMQKEQSQPDRAYGGFPVVAAANGTQGRTVYAANGYPNMGRDRLIPLRADWRPPPEVPPMFPSKMAPSPFPRAIPQALEFYKRLEAAKRGDRAAYKEELDAVLEASGGTGRLFNDLGLTQEYDPNVDGGGQENNSPSSISEAVQENARVYRGNGNGLPNEMGPGDYMELEAPPTPQGVPIPKRPWPTPPPIPAEWRERIEAARMRKAERAQGEDSQILNPPSRVAAVEPEGWRDRLRASTEALRPGAGDQVDADVRNFGFGRRVMPDQPEVRNDDPQVPMGREVTTGPRFATDRDMNERRSQSLEAELQKNVSRSPSAIRDEVYGEGAGVFSGPPLSSPARGMTLREDQRPNMQYSPTNFAAFRRKFEEDRRRAGLSALSGDVYQGEGPREERAVVKAPPQQTVIVPAGASNRPPPLGSGDEVEGPPQSPETPWWLTSPLQAALNRSDADIARSAFRNRVGVARLQEEREPEKSIVTSPVDDNVGDVSQVVPPSGLPLVAGGAPVAERAETVVVGSAPDTAARQADLAKWPTNVSPTVAVAVADAEGKSSFQQTRDVLQGRLDAVEQEDGADATQQATEFFKTLTDVNKAVYSDLKTKLTTLSKEDTKDFGELETRFKALDDFYKTGKLPERMRQDRITNLMLEMSKGLLGNQNLYDAFKAGVEGFQAVDKAARKEYADGLATMLTASKGIIDSKMAMRNSRRQESIAMTKFAAAENRGNASLAMDQLKIAQQAKQNARTHEINLIRGEATILQADIAMANAMKGSKIERLLKSMPKQMYPGILARARETGDTTELDKYYRKDSQGKVHANITAFIPHIAGLSSSGSSGLGMANFAMRVGAAQQGIVSDAKKDAKTLAVNWRDPVWRDVADFAKTKGFNPAGTIPSLEDWGSEEKGVKNKGWWQKMAEAYYRSIDKRASTLPGSSQRTTNQNQVGVQPKKDLDNIITAPQ